MLLKCYSSIMKPHKCSKCGRLTKGHSKPIGEECQLPDMSDSEIEAMDILDNQASGGQDNIPDDARKNAHDELNSRTDSGVGSCVELEKQLEALALEEKQMELLTAIEKKKRHLKKMKDELEYVRQSVGQEIMSDEHHTQYQPSPVLPSVLPSGLPSSRPTVDSLREMGWNPSNHHTAQPHGNTALVMQPQQSAQSMLPSLLSNGSSTSGSKSWPRGFGLTGSVQTTSYVYTGKTNTKYKKIVDYLPSNHDIEDDDEDVESIAFGENWSLKHNSSRKKLLAVTPTQYMVASQRILFEMRREMTEANLPLETRMLVEEQYSHHTIKIGEKNIKYLWTSVLLYDDCYRKRQAELDFPWGADAHHLCDVSMMERGQKRNQNRFGTGRNPGPQNRRPQKPDRFCGYFNKGEDCPYKSECNRPHICSMCGKNHSRVDHKEASDTKQEE